MADNAGGMATQPTVSTVEHGGFTVVSSNPEEAVRESLKDATPIPGAPQAKPIKDAPDKDGKPDLSKAASELGKKGGKAAAKARQTREAEAEPEAPAEEQKAKGAAPEAEAEAEAEEGEDAPEAEAKGKEGDPRRDPKARIAQLARERNEEREARQREAERAARLERELEAARRAPAPREQPEARQEARGPQERPGKPTPNEYGTWAEYEDARDQWNRQEWEREFVGRITAHREATRYAREVESVASGTQKFLQDAAKADPEFPDKARAALTTLGFPTRLLPEGTPTTAANWATDYLTSAGDAARDLLLHLSEHEDVLQRIITLEAPHAVARELAMIEASLKRPAAATTGTSAERSVSRANPPVAPVTGTPTVADGDIAPKAGESFDQWFARTGKNQKR